VKNSTVIIRFDEFCSRDNYDLRRIEGTATVDSIIRLIDAADMHANPRESKVGDVTDEIQESLAETPRWFHFKSKGILIAAGECKTLERRRFELIFENDGIEGILDGGHNLLAIGLFILRKALPEEEAAKILRGIKRWEQLPPIWNEHRDKIDVIKGELDFLIPLEIIYPQAGSQGLDTFQNAVLEVARARNNNAQLTEETKANKAGFYTEIRNSLDPVLEKEGEWKTNDGGRIKARDFVALAWIPLSRINENLPGLDAFKPSFIYNSKAQCVNLFNELMESDSVSKKDGAVRNLTHPSVKSAIALLKDIPRLYDLIYKQFPEAYNQASPGFGRMTCVSVYDPKKKTSDPKYLKKQPKTKFYRESVEYDFPDGFIMPLVWALRELISYKNGSIAWSVDPYSFINQNLEDIMRVYHGMVRLAEYDPQKVGKSGSIYELACNEFRGRLPR
jgi:hypothetical protein